MEQHEQERFDQLYAQHLQALIQLLQLTMHMRVLAPDPLPPRPPVLCDRCGEVITILARMVQLSQLSQPRLC
jgi:hypothetical protein